MANLIHGKWQICWDIPTLDFEKHDSVQLLVIKDEEVAKIILLRIEYSI